MKRRLFLCGPAFTGKSRLIREALGPLLQSAGGFCTAMELAPDGGMLGCSMMPAAAAGGVEGLEKQRFLDLRGFPPGHDSEVFRGLGVRLLGEAAWYPFAVLDEIGGMDLIIPQFRDALEGVFSSGLPVLGVIKSREACEQLRMALGPGPRFTDFSERLWTGLEADADTEILEIEEDAEQEAGGHVREWVREYAMPRGRKPC